MFRQAKPKAEAKKVEEQVKAAEAPLAVAPLIPYRPHGGIRLGSPVTKAICDALGIDYNSLSNLPAPAAAVDFIPLWYKNLRTGVFHFSPNVGPPTTISTYYWADYLTAHPFVVTRKMKLSAIGMFILAGGGAGAKMNLGIYESKANGEPASLLTQVQNLDASADITWIEGAIDVTLEPGLYFLAALMNNNDINIAAYYTIATPLGVTNTGTIMGKWYVAYPFGALPATFPAVTDADLDIYLWGIGVKVASLF
jgi:hypothetical protein